MKSSFLTLLSLPALLISCARSDPARNALSGVAHPKVVRAGGREWPALGTEPKAPHGILFPAHGPARATLLCLHGIQTHAAWFAPLAEKLNQAGINVLAMDRRGSGMNTASPFVKGDAGGTGDLLADLERQMTWLHDDPAFRGVPVYLLGTSWGSNTAGAYALREHVPHVQGLALLVPATRSRFEEKSSGAQALLGSIFTPRLTRKLPFGDEHYHPGVAQPDPSSGEPREPLAKPMFNEVRAVNPKLTSLLHDDASILVQKPSARLLHAGLSMAATWRGSDTQLKIPLLVIVAECDQIMDNDAAWQGARRHHSHPSLHIVRGAGHGAQITDADEIARTLLRWLPQP